MERSNGYVIGFAAILTIVCGGLLALANQGLKDKQEKSIQLDTRKQILNAVMPVNAETNVNEIYEAQVVPYVVNVEGNKIEGVDAEKVNTKKVYKEKDIAKKQLPVFEFKNANGVLEAYIIPVYGKGLWDDVWGYIALEKDLNTVKGVSFGHKGETPGLGARITDKEIQDRFIGKKISDGGIAFIKGEAVRTNFSDHEVDGLSGATMTTNGVNAMLKAYFAHYNNYFTKTRN